MDAHTGASGNRLNAGAGHNVGKAAYHSHSLHTHRMRQRLGPLGAAIALIALAGACSRASKPATSPTPAGGGQRANSAARSDTIPEGSGRGGVGGAGGGGMPEPNPRPYNRVITRDAKSRAGLISVHRLGSKLFFEIPNAELGKDELLVSEIAKTTLGVGYGGQALNNRVLRWERRDNRVLLRSVSYEVIAGDTANPVVGAVQAANVSPIIAVFNVEAYGKDSSMVIDVTRLFTQVPTEMSPSQRISPRATIDPTRSWIERAVAFPDNVNVETTLTFNNPPAPQGQGGGQQPPRTFGQGGTNAPSATMVMSYSIHRLPDVPMMARLCDNRVGYFSLSLTDYARPEQKSTERCFITRYRLEKKDPSAAVSEPVKQIVYYIDPATPKQWVPWLIKGVNDWQPAFEAAGFKNAIVAREAPNDPDWSPEDARYSVIRWLPSTVQNASGPHVHDPRSGEIINAHIQFYHNVQTLARTWYYTQAAAVDPRARSFPLPDSLMGRLLEYVVAHEVGHTLGFQHNMKASSTYPLDSLRNRSFLARMGHTPTLMDYSRFNYVAQPEDSIPVELLVPGIGPYDIWATHWGYAPIPQAKTPDEERQVLDAWAREQDAKPYLRFSTSGSFGADPGEETEAVGDIDAVKATALGIKNLRREMAWLQSTTVRPTEDFDELSALYDGMMSQWMREMGHVANVIGGATSQEKYGGQPGARFTPLPKSRQKEAMRFLADNALQTPSFLIDREVRGRLGPVGEIDRVQRAQASIINTVLSDGRMTRLVEFTAMAPDKANAYSLGEMLGDLRHGVWTEIYAGAPRIDAYRRALQRSYLETIDRKINPPADAGQGGGFQFGPQGPPPLTGEIQTMLRGELRDLDRELAAASGRAGDRDTRLHIEGARSQIREILDPVTKTTGVGR